MKTRSILLAIMILLALVAGWGVTILVRGGTQGASFVSEKAFEIDRSDVPAPPTLSPEDEQAIKNTIAEFAALTTQKDDEGVLNLLAGRLKDVWLAQWEPHMIERWGIEKMTVSSAEIESILPSEVVVHVVLDIALASESHTAYDEGLNDRWFHMIKLDGQWKITEMASSP